MRMEMADEMKVKKIDEDKADVVKLDVYSTDEHEVMHIGINDL